MFTDKQFNVVAKVDKYGRKMSKKDNYALQNYYQKGDKSDGDSGSGSSFDEEGEYEMMDESGEAEQSMQDIQDERDEDQIGNKYYDKDGNF